MITPCIITGGVRALDGELLIPPENINKHALRIVGYTFTCAFLWNFASIGNNKRRSMLSIFIVELSFLKLLGEDLLPNFHPLLLLGCKSLARVLERSRENISQSSAQGLDYKHGLPV
jgi:hypothetical protein